jgi:hypothetical protein
LIVRVYSSSIFCGGAGLAALDCAASGIGAEVTPTITVASAAPSAAKRVFMLISFESDQQS